jgi:integrase
VSAIDSPRPMVHVHRGKGAQDRSVPLPHETLALLRLSWKTHRNPTLLFPACGRDHTHRATATSPMRRRSVQGAFRTATQRAGIIKRDVGVHTLRQG